MALMDGKQLRNGSVSLDKLNSVDGIVTFTSATMSFATGSTLRVEDGNIQTGLDVVNRNYVDSAISLVNGDFITGVTAGSGLSGGGTSGFVTLDVNASNGLSISSDSVVLGGTLSGNTSINAGGYNLTIGDIGTFSLTSSSLTFELEADSLNVYTNGIILQATGSISITPTDDFNLNTNTASITTSNSQGLVYSSDYSSTFVSNSLVSKSYVDSAISVVNGDFITGVTAGSGLSGGGTSGFVNLDVNVSNGLTIISDSVQISDTAAGTGLTFSSGIFNVNLGLNSGLTFSGDNIIIDSNISGNGLDFSSGVLSVNTSEITSALAGNGLTANGSALDVNVNSDSLEISGDSIRLKDTITGDRNFQNSVTIGGDLTVSGTTSYINTENLLVRDNIVTLNATYSGPAISQSGIEVNVGNGTYSKFIWDSTSHWIAGASGSESYVVTKAGTGLTQSFDTLSLDVNNLVDNGLSISGNKIILGGTLSQNTTIDASTHSLTLQRPVGSVLSKLELSGTNLFSSYDSANNSEFGISLTNAGDSTGDSRLFADLGTYSNRIITNQDFSKIIADDKTGSSASIITLSSDPVVNSDTSVNNYMTIQDEIAQKGLVYYGDYTTNFTDNSLVTKQYVDNAVSTIDSTPVYDIQSSLVTSGNGSTTGLSLSSTPNNYSRVQVFINGQLQHLGNGASSSVDCYFSNDGGSTPLSLNSLSSSDTLYWNGTYASFNLATTDKISVVYES